MNLTKREIESNYHVEDFMIPIEECPVVYTSELNLRSILQTIENGNMGFCLVTDDEFNFKGLISSADIRKAMLKKLNDLNEIVPDDLINSNPVSINNRATVIELLQRIKRCNFPVMYLPVLNNDAKAVGIVNFVHLIKGEI
jgi:CBS domain-containing protein